MDFQSLKEQIAGISLYDVKAAVRKAQNVVMNYTEMEAKVREATNNEPWGASSTLMQEIANGTYNYQLLNEIMPMIYKRFTEKSAEEWRQIYKSLQLLEFLVKNGSEQVIDDARSHISTIKMLRQFHFIDMNGKDQGVNVRNRAKELGELLSDVDRIRAERKKARATKNKYGGVEGGGFGGGFSSGLGGGSGAIRSSRYGGFGSDSAEYGGYGSDQVYGDGGGFGGSSSRYDDERVAGFGGSRRGDNKQKFEEYDEYDEGAPKTQSLSTARRSQSSPTTSTKTTTAPPPEKTQSAPVADLLFGDEPAPVGLINGKASAKNPLDDFDDFATIKAGPDDDDDFDEFQVAPAPPSTNISSNFPIQLSGPPAPATSSVGTISSTATTFAAPQPRSSQQAANITGLVGMTTPKIQKSPYNPPPINNNTSPLASLSTPAPATSTAYQPSQPNYFTSVPAIPSNSSSMMYPQSTGGILSPTTAPKPASTTTRSANDAFGSIWATAAASGIKKPSSAGAKATTPVQTASMADLAKSKAQSGLWGTPGTSTGYNSFGSFGGAMGGSSSTKDDLDDFLG
ncbi:hypothetical protein BGX38DRAFT_1248990 [Terfezia claveryi]|nr:hypothetical protein BGX38DRAFT_1248990 [Terfezia claveryi]